MRAWFEDAYWSSTLISAPSARPKVAPFVRSRSVPGSKPRAATTSRRGLAAGWSGAGFERRRPSRGSGPPSRTGSGVSPRVRSRCALRATQSRNRYSTARKPNLSATASGSSTLWPSVELERQLGHTQRDPVAGLEGGVVHPPAVHLDAVGGAQVHHRPAPVLAADLSVAAGDVGIGEHHVAFPAAAEQHPRPGQHGAPALAHEQGLGARRRRLELARGPVGRVDHGGAEVARRRSRLEARLLLFVLGLGEKLGLDPELAQLQSLVRHELHLGPARQGEPLVAGVLEQVVGELLAKGRLIARELLAVVR